MVDLASLWLPILLSAVAVFLASSVIHMATTWHAADYPKVPNEDAVSDALRPFAIPPGDYMMPRAGTMKDMATPEFQAKMARGPVLMMTVFPNGPGDMTRSLILWFVYSAVVATFAGYVAGAVLGPGAPYLAVFRIVGTVAFVGYALALWQLTIWYKRAIGTTLRSTIDGLLYALITAGVFGWRWP